MMVDLALLVPARAALSSTASRCYPQPSRIPEFREDLTIAPAWAGANASEDGSRGSLPVRA